MASRTVLVTGDAILDRQVYVEIPDPQSGKPGTLLVDSGGGALLVTKCLTRIVATLPDRQSFAGGTTDDVVHKGISLTEDDLAAFPEFHCFATYRPQLPKKTSDEKKEAKLWRADADLGYGPRSGNGDGKKLVIKPAPALRQRHFLWVIDDANRGFRTWSVSDAKPDGAAARPQWPDLWPQWTQEEKPDWVVYKMCAPHATGDLWRALVAGNDKVPDLADRMVAVFSIQDLRADGVMVTRGLSWERSLSDVVRWMTQQDELQILLNPRKARYVVVGFGAEGAVVFDNVSRDVRLVFDFDHVEGEWFDQHPGTVFGLQTILTSSIAAALLADGSPVGGAEDDSALQTICRGVRAGLHGIRALISGGHGPVQPMKKDDGKKRAASATRTSPTDQPSSGEKSSPNAASGGDRNKDSKNEFSWPFEPVAKCVSARLTQDGADECFGEFRARLDDPSLISVTDAWRILDRQQAGLPPDKDQPARRSSPLPHYGKGRLVAEFGLAQSGTQVPCLKIGKLMSVDRKEIESLRTIKLLIENYVGGGAQKRPLCLGVFGQPGCGKSFGVKEVARSFVADDVPILEFNLSQFRSPDELVAALHQVRDKVLQGHTPVVFWDEFDSRDNKWLRYLLAPMQDGRFRDGALEHTIGKSIFVFAGGTCYDFASFGPPESWEHVQRHAHAAGLSSEELKKRSEELKQRYDDERQSFVKAKGPDFKSRLNGFLDVAGPNQRQTYHWSSQEWKPDESDCGFPIRRAQLLRAQLGKKGQARLEMDSGLLTALVLIDYRHGARSMEKIVEQMKALSGGKKIMRSHLPPRDVLALHVDVEEFDRLLNTADKFRRKVHEIAPKLHDNYLDGVRECCDALLEEAKKLQTEAEELRRRADGQRESDLIETANRLEAQAEQREQVVKAIAVKPEVDVDFNKLALSYQEDNVRQAARLPEMLLCVQREIVPDSVRGEDALELTPQEIEVLAQYEHTRWMAGKLADGWSYGSVRDEEQKLHPCIADYEDLDEPTKEKDRRLFKNLAMILEKVKFKLLMRTGKADVGQTQETGGIETQDGGCD